ncbi:ATP-binding protein [Desulfosudis oleivorans]|uniref:4Fe-4S ferredoxin-type domain-containing protein n=1 Tax=Desulfosudis oleivorans (strain DSM 6200 / JCM 39069 / Hxd3) TaxID=96561 RepID=A8ZSU0_DESOH|nr:4Fe-4S dicluster domain-containing protein [Desulfosudis oleivorans]ABW66003.1 hypothetical protein Dole_0193 [Desulfosudis oleivorans Hxd3]
MTGSVAAIQEAPAALPKKARAPKRQAMILDWCTGCGGVPVCRIYCKFDALQLVDDPDNYPFKRMTVNRVRCVGCGACISSGPDGLVLTGCPWNAIRLVPVENNPHSDSEKEETRGADQPAV